MSEADSSSSSYVSRAGRKLEAALRAFDVDVRGMTCADLGSHTGGFVDCLLQHGAACVHAVDPGYGVLAYALRRDDRVVVHERTNALRWMCADPCDVITIDVGWTTQQLILPSARRSLRPGGRVITLVKPQYEAPKEWLERGVVPQVRLPEVLAICREDAERQGWTLKEEIESPLRGHGGNVEFLWLLTPPH